MDGPVRLAFVGDIMPGGIDYSDNFADNDLIGYFKQFDLRIGTLECAIGNGFPFDPIKMNNKKWQNIVYAQNEHLSKLKKININVVSLANNHVFDLGVEGLKNTIYQLDKLGISYLGAGLDEEQAGLPLILKVKGRTIGFLAYSSPTFWAPHPPSKDNPGVNQFHLNKAISDVQSLKKRCEFVFVLPHWGVENTYFPTEKDYLHASKIIQAGADGIIGSHSHRIQPVIPVKNKLVFFSLGNFYFPDRIICPPRSTWYPSSHSMVNIKNLPQCYNYPFVKEPTLKIWKPKARIGMIATFILNDKIQSKYTLTRLTRHNKVAFKHNAWVERLVLQSISVFIIILGRKFFKILNFLRALRKKL